MPRPSRELVMTTLFASLQASLHTKFTANIEESSAVLSSPSTTQNLTLGLPVFGADIPRGAIISSLSPLTLSEPASETAIASELTAGFLTFGRRLKYWDQVKAQPALFLLGGDEEFEYQQTVLQVQQMTADVVIYSKVGTDAEATPESELNNLLDAVQAAFAPDDPMQQRFTLGGLVYWCRLAGKVLKWTGDGGPQAVAIAPVEIYVP
jgi:hypothetical protein